MKRVRSYKTASVLGALFVGAFLALNACSNQGEGERCESLQGNDDCDTTAGLICFRAALLVGTTSDRCCPQDQSLATTPVCKAPVSGVGGDASAPADTGPPPTADASVHETGTSDADATTDAPNDG